MRHFLPIRGHKVMDETLKFFMKEDCAGFRLIYNAIAYLGLFDAKATSLPANGLETADAVELLQVLANVDAAIHAMFDHLDQQAKAETVEMQTLLAAEFEQNPSGVERRAGRTSRRVPRWSYRPCARPRPDDSAHGCCQHRCNRLCGLPKTSSSPNCRSACRRRRCVSSDATGRWRLPYDNRKSSPRP